MDTKINERIKSLRLSKGCTQRMIAAYLNVSQKTYSDYERNKLSISVDTLIRLAEYYNVSLDYFCGKSDDLKTDISLEEQKE